MNADTLQATKAAGFTHVQTLAGAVPLDEFNPSRPLRLEDGALVSEWRKPQGLERLLVEDQGKDPDTVLARDLFPLITKDAYTFTPQEARQ